MPLLLCFLYFAGVSHTMAQTADEQVQSGDTTKPIVQTKLSQTEVAPGQAVTFQITVMVPTWLTKPVTFPVFDRPNLSVTLPDKSTVSTSQTINGATWSGVIREYQVVPLTPGAFQLPPSNLEVHYRNPEGANDITRKISLSSETLAVKAPKGTESLKPYIAARALKLEQQIEGDPENLHPGDSFSRTVTATIEGSTVMFVPQLLNTSALSGVAAYTDTPQARDQGESGTRVEKITYVAESAARGALPAIALRWYDLEDGSIQTTNLDPINFRVKGAPSISQFSPQQWLLTLALITALGWVAWHGLRPLLARVRKRRQQDRRASGKDALQKLHAAAKKCDYSSALSAAMALESHLEYADSGIPEALLALGRAQYGNTPATESATHLWRNLELAADIFATQCRARTRAQSRKLPPLNTT